MGKKTALVLGAGGFIGGHLATALKSEGYFVVGVDLKFPEFRQDVCNEFILGDLRDRSLVSRVFEMAKFDLTFQLAADMGGAGFVFTGENDANIMHNSCSINLNVLEKFRQSKSADGVIFYSSSACIYPERNQLDPGNPICTEDSAYPAEPDSEYGWEKIFSERLYATYARNYGLNVRIGRYHNIFGPFGTYVGGREKAPAALCRKVIEATQPGADGTVEVWGDGQQTRSFLYVDECVEATLRLVRCGYAQPLNIGSDEMVSISDLISKIEGIADVKVSRRYIEGPIGVRGRTSDNRLIKRVLGWAPGLSLEDGLRPTYQWIDSLMRYRQ